jgi:hypothetical protein
MSKDGFNEVSKGVDDKVSFSTKDMELGARVLCKAMAGSDGKTVGDIASKAIWELAERKYHPATIELIMKQAKLEWEPS